MITMNHGYSKLGKTIEVMHCFIEHVSLLAFVTQRTLKEDKFNCNSRIQLKCLNSAF